MIEQTLAKMITAEDVKEKLPELYKIGSGEGAPILQKAFGSNVSPEWIKTVYPIVRKRVSTVIKDSLVTEAESESELTVVLSPKAKRNLIILLIGAAVVLVLVLFLHYQRKRKAYGEIYTIQDLLKEVWEALKKGTKYFLEEILWSTIKKLLGVAMTIVIVAVVVRYLIPPKWLRIDSKSPFLKRVFVHIVTFITGKQQMETVIPPSSSTTSSAKT
jgi:hypothetical protein